jgi:Ricin-type beta-trefoil lectin domain
MTLPHPALIAATACSAVLLIVGIPSAMADEAGPAGGAIQNVASGLCLGVHDSSTSVGADAVVGTCSGDSSQTWYPNASTTIAMLTYAQYRNGLSGLCLGVTGASAAEGAQLVQETCSGTNDHSQFWTNLGIGHSGRFEARNGHSGWCLAIQGASPASGAKAVQGDCGGIPEPVWTFVAAQQIGRER